MTQQFESLQTEMRRAFLDGAPGMLVSAAVWLTAGGMHLRTGATAAMWTLLVGGMFIHPLSLVVLKLMRRSASAPGNPLMSLALATTVWLITGCLLAYGLSTANSAWFFPAMLLVIGVRYLAFQLLYGRREYLLCGGALMLAGCASVWLHVAPAVPAFAGGVIEVIFGVLLLRAHDG